MATFVGIYLLVEFFDKVDNFIEHGAAASSYLYYFGNKIPLIISQVIPLAVLMGVFMTLGGLSRTNELTAIRACGLSLLRITWPLILVSLITAITILLMNEFLVPLSARTVNTSTSRALIACSTDSCRSSAGSEFYWNRGFIIPRCSGCCVSD